MKKIFLLFAFLFANTLFANLNVVTTTEDLASIVKAIGKSNVSVSAIVTGARDPHRIEARPSFMQRVRNANLFIAIGLDLEIGWERAVIDGSGNSRVRPGSRGHLYASTNVPVLEKSTEAVTRAMGDVHPHGNPHIWVNPYNVRIMARSIANRMAELDKSKESVYKKNAEDFITELDAKMFGTVLVARFGGDRLWNWHSSGNLQQQLNSANASQQLSGWSARMLPHRGKPIITYHRSWSYFADCFGLKVVGELEPKPGIDPTPGHLNNIVKIANEEKVKAILIEPYYSKRYADHVASRSQASTVVVPLSVSQDASAKDYFSLIDTIVNRVSNALGK